MSSTGFARCPACHDQGEDCEKCGGNIVATLGGAASVRGQLWAERVVKALIARWPARWPSSPRAVMIAYRQVQDLARTDSQRATLARICLEKAALRFAELRDVLARRRLDLPPRDDETPE